VTEPTSDDGDPAEPPPSDGTGGEFEIEAIETDGLPDDVNDRVLRHEQRRASAFQLFGALVIVVGLIFIGLGVTGAVAVDVQWDGRGVSLRTGVVGFVVVLAGAWIFWVASPNIKIKK